MGTEHDEQLGAVLWTHETDADQASVSFNCSCTSVPETTDARSDAQAGTHLPRSVALAGARAVPVVVDGPTGTAVHRFEATVSVVA